MAARKRKAPLPALSDEGLRALHRAAQQVWNDIAYDCLQASGESSFSRAEVVELVVDASRLEMQLDQDAYPGPYRAKSEAAERQARAAAEALGWWRAHQYERAADKVVAGAFSPGRHGW